MTATELKLSFDGHEYSGLYELLGQPLEIRVIGVEDAAEVNRIRHRLSAILATVSDNHRNLLDTARLHLQRSHPTKHDAISQLEFGDSIKPVSLIAAERINDRLHCEIPSLLSDERFAFEFDDKGELSGTDIYSTAPPEENPLTAADKKEIGRRLAAGEDKDAVIDDYCERGFESSAVIDTVYDKSLKYEVAETVLKGVGETMDAAGGAIFWVIKVAIAVVIAVFVLILLAGLASK